MSGKRPDDLLEDSIEALAEGSLDLDELMSISGVRRGGQRPRKKATDRAKPPQGPSSKPAPRPGRGATPSSSTSARAQPVRPPPAAPVPKAQLERMQALESLVQTLRSELDKARSERDEVRSRLRPLRRERDEAREEARSASDRADRMAARVSRVEQDNPLLSTLLEEQGFRGSDERAAAIRALLDAHRWGEIESMLVPIDPALLRLRLSRHVVLHCGESDCPRPSGVALVRVGRDRCEVCGGEGQPSLQRAISDCLMLNGCRVLLLRGGRPWELRLLRDGVDRRLTVDLDRGQDEPDALRVAWGLPVREGELAAEVGIPALVQALRAWSEGR
jgi:hypothetical protein